MKVTYNNRQVTEDQFLKYDQFVLDFTDPNFESFCKEKMQSGVYTPIKYEGFRLQTCMWSVHAKVEDLLAVNEALTELEIPQLVVEKYIRYSSLASMRNFKSSYVGKFMTTSEVDCLAFFTKVMPLALADDFYSIHVFDQYKIYENHLQ